MNQNIVDKLTERIINEANSAVSCLTLYLGHKLDLFNLKSEGPVTFVLVNRITFVLVTKGRRK